MRVTLAFAFFEPSMGGAGKMDFAFLDCVTSVSNMGWNRA